MNWEAALLTSSLSLLAYTWAGYPAMLLALRRAAARPSLPESGKPKVSIIVAVHNEEEQIAAKLEDCLALRYPPGSVEILVASDGCTDATEEIVQGFAARDQRIRLLRAAGRAGKSGAQNLAAENACGEILLFTDAGTRTRPNLLELLAKDFVDPRIGLVAAVVHFGRFDTAVSQSQGAYWRFELFLRQLESDLGILATASGAAFAIRRPLFLPIPAQFGDDCIVPLNVRLQAFRVLQDGRAIVSDQMPCSVEAELRARIRMTARNWGGILSRPGLLNPFRFPGTAWGLLSHKFLRWMTPFFLAAMFLANALLASRSQFRLLFALQVCFYVAALIGWRRSRQRECEPIFGYPFAFCLANIGFLLGILRSFLGPRVVAYKDGLPMKNTFKPGSDTGRRWAGLTLLPVPGSETEAMKCAAEAVGPATTNSPLPCPVCLSEEHQTLSRHKNNALNRCLACGASFVVPQPSPKDAAAHFKNDYGLIPEDLHHRFERNRERVLVRVAHQIKCRQERGKILDVGCATGFFLARFFSASRWQRWAVELSPRKAHIAAQSGIQVHVGDIHQAEFEARVFDVITVLDAFYYFPDPHSALGEFHRILKNEGLLLLELPWAGSRIWRRSWILRWLLRDRPVPLLESSDHLFYYTPQSISGLLDRSGFRVQAVLALPGNRQETIFRDFLCRAYSFFSALIQIVSHSKCFLGPRFLVVAAKQPLAASGASPLSLRRQKEN